MMHLNLNLKFKTFIKFFIYLPFLIFSFVILFIRPFVIVRLGKLTSERIGHFTCVVELYLSEKKLKFKNNKKYLDFFCIDDYVCNQQIYKFFKKKLNFVPKLFVTSTLFWLNLFYKKNPHDIFNCQSVKDNYNFFHHRDVNNILDKTTRNFFFTKSEIQLSRKFFKKKINLRLPIVIFYIRDNFFFEKNLKDYDAKRLSLKNPNISSYIEPINFLLNQGYAVVRIGKNTKNKLNIKNKNFYDLSNSNYRTDLLEAYISSISKFIFGSNSGALYSYAYLFRKPCLVTNYIPPGLMHSYSKIFYYNFKKYCWKKNNKILTLSEIFRNGLGFNESKNLINNKKIKVIDQTSSELLNTLNDFIKYIENDFKISKKEQKIKKTFIKKYLSLCSEDDFFNKIHGQIKCNFGLSYLKKSQFLLK